MKKLIYGASFVLGMLAVSFIAATGSSYDGTAIHRTGPQRLTGPLIYTIGGGPGSANLTMVPGDAGVSGGFLVIEAPAGGKGGYVNDAGFPPGSGGSIALIGGNAGELNGGTPGVAVNGTILVGSPMVFTDTFSASPPCSVAIGGAITFKSGGAGVDKFCICRGSNSIYIWCSLTVSTSATVNCAGGSATACP